jgi:hypothetical protein
MIFLVKTPINRAFPLIFLFLCWAGNDLRSQSTTFSTRPVLQKGDKLQVSLFHKNLLQGEEMEDWEAEAPAEDYDRAIKEFKEQESEPIPYFEGLIEVVSVTNDEILMTYRHLSITFDALLSGGFGNMIGPDIQTEADAFRQDYLDKVKAEFSYSFKTNTLTLKNPKDLSEAVRAIAAQYHDFLGVHLFESFFQFHRSDDDYIPNDPQHAWLQWEHYRRKPFLHEQSGHSEVDYFKSMLYFARDFAVESMMAKVEEEHKALFLIFPELQSIFGWAGQSLQMKGMNSIEIPFMGHMVFGNHGVYSLEADQFRGDTLNLMGMWFLNESQKSQFKEYYIHSTLQVMNNIMSKNGFEEKVAFSPSEKETLFKGKGELGIAFSPVNRLPFFINRTAELHSMEGEHSISTEIRVTPLWD